MALGVTLNGHTRSFASLDDPTTLAALLADLGLKADRVAVELNGTIVPRESWPKTPVVSDDRLEVVHFVGGGSMPTPPRGA